MAEGREAWREGILIEEAPENRYDQLPDFEPYTGPLAEGYEPLSGQPAALDNGFPLWEILLGTALLYGLAVGAALFIRYRIEKKPLGQGLAFGYAAGIWFGLYSLFFALHALAGQAEQWVSKPPIGHAIAAIIAYHVMRKASAPVATASAAAPGNRVTPSATQVDTESFTRWKPPAHWFHAVVLAIVGIMLLFPPWNEERFSLGRAGVAQVTAVGYGSVFSPPERQNNRSRVVIDWSRLMSQIGAVLFLAWAVQTLYSSAAEGEKEGYS